MFNKNYAKDYSKLVAQSWLDPAFRTRFINFPEEVLREHGIDIPDGVTVKVNPDTANGTIVFGLPPRPAELSDEDIRHHRFDMFGSF